MAPSKLDSLITLPFLPCQAARPARVSKGQGRSTRSRGVSSIILTAGMFIAATSMGCVGSTSGAGARTPQANKWLTRAQQSYETLDMQDAADSAKEALRSTPQDHETRMLAASIALAQLDYAAAIKLTDNLAGSDALAIRARAFWYNGDIRKAGMTLESLLHDPEVRDPWAKEVSKLTNRGAGREPFRVDGSVVAAVEMPPVRGGAMVVPVEIDGEQGLAMIATGTAEVVLDGSQRKEPAWVSLRFNKRIEFHDVPALTQDLTGLSRQLGAPIKALLGINLLRHANPTFDLLGRQFVVRRFEPPRPPAAAEVPVYYARGGGMLVNTKLGTGASAPKANFFLDTASLLPLSLAPSGWKKAGVAPSSLMAVQGAPNLKQGRVPLMRLGVFDLPQVQAVTGDEITRVSKSLGIPIDGVVGGGVIGQFRVTLTQGGRAMWLEKEYGEQVQTGNGRPQEGATAAPGPAGDHVAPGANVPEGTGASTPPAARPLAPSSAQ